MKNWPKVVLAIRYTMAALFVILGLAALYDGHFEGILLIVFSPLWAIKAR